MPIWKKIIQTTYVAYNDIYEATYLLAFYRGHDDGCWKRRVNQGTGYPSSLQRNSYISLNMYAPISCTQHKKT